MAIIHGARWDLVEFSLPAVSRVATTWWSAVGPRVVDGVLRLAPQLERWVWDAAELALGPKRAFRQLALACCVQCAIVWWQLVQRRRRRRGAADPYETLTDRLARATSLDVWLRAAAALDEADGALEWRSVGGVGEKFLDARALRGAARRLRSVLATPTDDGEGRVHAAMYALRGGALLARDAHGMGEPRLFERARTGGPKLLDEYLDAALRAVDFVERASDSSVPTDARLAFFNECRHTHGRTALLLSGGAGLGAYHLGVVSALREARMLPRVISGASAGSIVAATVCCRTDSELAAIFHAVLQMGDADDDYNDYHGGPAVDAVEGDPIFRLDFFRWRSSSNTLSLDEDDDAPRRRRSSGISSSRQASTVIPEEHTAECPVEDDDDDGRRRGDRKDDDDEEALFQAVATDRDDDKAWLLDVTPREMSSDPSALMCGDHLANVIRTNAGGDYTFQEAFDRTGKILNIPVREHDPTAQTGRVKAAAAPRLLNYLTAPHVVVWSASRASCAVPGVFAPAPLLVRERDGSLCFEDDTTRSRGGDDGVNTANGTSAASSRRKRSGHRTVYVDGSMGADLPMETMRTLFNCNHFICSQTNVHAAVLGDSALRLVGATAPGVRQPPAKAFSAHASLAVQSFDAAHAVLRFVKTMLKTWVRAGTALAAELLTSREKVVADERATSAGWWERLVPWQFAGWALAVMTQPYEGRPQDVTIVPWAGHLSVFGSFIKAFDNPCRGEPIADVMEAGRKNTWNELAKIKAHTAVEFALERAVQRLRLALFRQREPVQTAAAAALETKDAVGRTPSFYTSPSLLQLSGLAVVDPVVNVDDGCSRAPSPAPTLPQLHEQLQLDADTTNGGTGLLRDASFSSRRRPRAASADDLATSRGVVAPDHHDNSFIVKTSTMANFYYRKPPSVRSRSDDKLAYQANNRKNNNTSPLLQPSWPPPTQTNLEKQASVTSDVDGGNFF